MDRSTMTQEQKLELGIEIVAAMKASCNNWDMEHGRIDALSDTEMDRISLTPEEFDALPKDSQEMIRKSVVKYKERLHQQALFAAEAVCAWFDNKESEVSGD